MIIPFEISHSHFDGSMEKERNAQGSATHQANDVMLYMRMIKVSVCESIFVVKSLESRPRTPLDVVSSFVFFIGALLINSNPWQLRLIPQILSGISLYSDL